MLAPYAARYSDDDIVAGGYLIPAGTPIVIALGVSLKNETIWKNPEKYVYLVGMSINQTNVNFQPSKICLQLLKVHRMFLIT